MDPTEIPDAFKGPLSKKRKRENSGSSTSTPETTQTGLTITEVGAIKVGTPRSKKHSAKTTKSKTPKAKRIKFDDYTQKDDDANIDTSLIDDGISDETTGAVPWHKPTFTCQSGKNIITIAFEEIALEGLDGITLQALWIRVSLALCSQPPLSRNLMEYIWKNIRVPHPTDCMKAYLLDTPRSNLIVPMNDRPDEDIYPYELVCDTKNRVIGSCSTYKQRKQIEIHSFTLPEVEIQFGNRLVLVGSQELRANALISPYADPRFRYPVSAFVGQQYCLLEKIGRSRRQGEITTGPHSLSDLIKDPKTLFYHRMQLQQSHLVRKQIYRSRNERNTTSNSGLLHLLRFYVEVKSERQLIIEHIIKLIKQKPQFRMEYMELRRVIGMDVWEKYLISKMIKTQEFRQFVRTDLILPYRVLYPNATVSEWKQKAKETEKSLRVLELRNPNLNVNYIFKDEKDDTEVSNEFEINDASEHAFGMLSISRIYETICEAGPSGVTLRRLSQRADCDHHTARLLCKSLHNKGLVNHTLYDDKRQHYLVYVASAYTRGAPEPTDERQSREELTHDDETFDFIAGVLKLNKECLKTPIVTKIEMDTVKPEESENTYAIIDKLRKDKDEESLKIHLGNKHPFVAAPVRPMLLPPKTNPSSKTKQFFSSLCAHVIENQQFVPVCQYDITANKSIIDSSMAQKLSKSIKRPKHRQLVTFEPFKCLISFNYKVKEYEFYDEMAQEYKHRLLSDSDEEILEEANSEDALYEGYEGYPREIIPQHIKQTFIDHFHEQNSEYRDKLHGPPMIIEKIVEKIEPELCEENFFNVDMEIFMGPQPRVLEYSKDFQEVETMLVMSTLPQHFTNTRRFVSDSHRVQSRMKLVKDCINHQKAVIDLYKIQTIINEEERAEGYNVTVDRKSLHRIFATLVRDGDIQIIKIIVKYRNIIRTKNLMTLPQYNIETVLQSIVDQFKNSFIIYAKRKVFETERRDTATWDHLKRRRFKYSRFIGRTYGFNPKISKMRILHEFLFYLIRGYTGSPIPRAEAVAVLSNYCNSDIVDDVIKESTTLYQRETSWKMFITPLPLHKDWPEGWALISDVLLRLPLSLFVKLFNVSFIIPALPSYLNHPIRKHYIVNNLPPEIKDGLLGTRKYIFSIHEVICLDAYMGLIQFGPQKLREKDQVFIYLNKNAIFYDTTSSDSGYHHITQKTYPKLTYEFNTAADVQKYWSDLFYHAIHTKLGNRTSVIGQNIKLEYVHAKTLLSFTLLSQTAESAAAKDVGYLPGDGLGACCSDSAIWLHVKKNWHWNSKPSKSGLGTKQVITGYRRKHLEDIRQMKLSDLHQQHRKGKKFRVVTSPSSSNVSLMVKSKTTPSRSIKKKVILRKVKPRKVKEKLQLRTDNVDKKIMDRVGRSRSTFTPEEDRLIIVCLVCNDYLTSMNKKRTVTSIVFRDFMHKMLAHSRKTSLSYRRRGIHLRKNGAFENQIEELNLKISGDFYTEKYFGKFRMDRNAGKIVSDSIFNLAFVYLAYFTYKRFLLNSDSMDQGKNEVSKDYLATGSNHQFQEISEKEESFCKDPTNEEEINLDTVQSVIHSSLGGYNSDPKWPYQVLRVYQTFPEDLLRNAISNMRDYQIISGRKLKMGQEGTILMSGVTYNLSFNYTYKQITLFPHCVFNEAHEILSWMVSHVDQAATQGISFEKFEQGHGLGIGEIQICREVHWMFELPEDIITLNPNLSDFSELITELTQRYNELMKKSQEADDGTYDPEAIKQLVSTLKSFKQDKFEEENCAEECSSVDSGSLTNQSARSSSEECSKVDSGTEVSTVIESDKDPTASSSVSTEELSLGNEDTFIMDCSESSVDIISPSDSGPSVPIGNFGKTDRRSKGWRISDMAFMLTKGLFPELDDDERLEKLNEHFIVRYPTCRVKFVDFLKPDDPLFMEWHHKVLAESKAILHDVLQDSLINNTLLRVDELDSKAEELLNFINQKHHFGATSKDIKENFPKECVEELHGLIKIGLVLRVGVCYFSFVHHSFRHHWSIPLSDDDNEENYAGFRLRISPWIRINGEVDSKVLEKWMGVILGHCLTYPCTPFARICARFNIIKPVDIYYIIEILQRLGCIEIWSYLQDGLGQDIFSDFGILEQVPSSTIDDFDDVFVETKTSAITKFGAFLNRNKTNFAYVFQEDE